MLKKYNLFQTAVLIGFVILLNPTSISMVWADVACNCQTTARVYNSYCITGPAADSSQCCLGRNYSYRQQVCPVGSVCQIGADSMGDTVAYCS
jgi:hypothetical protein